MLSSLLRLIVQKVRYSSGRLQRSCGLPSCFYWTAAAGYTIQKVYNFSFETDGKWVSVFISFCGTYFNAVEFICVVTSWKGVKKKKTGVSADCKRHPYPVHEADRSLPGNCVSCHSGPSEAVQSLGGRPGPILLTLAAGSFLALTLIGWWASSDWRSYFFFFGQ